nr:AMP-binding protein [Candidatus Freyarchaeota archaeon]
MEKNCVDLYGDSILKPWHEMVTQSPWVEDNRPWQKILPKNFPRTLNYPEAPLFEICDQAALKFRNNVSVCMITQNQKYTYLEMKYYSDQLAAALSDRLNIGKGVSVAVDTWNSPEFVFSLFGVNKTGASCTLINPLLTAEDVEYTINDAEIVDTIIVDSKVYPKIKHIKKLKNFIIAGKEEIPGTTNFWKLIKLYKPQPPEVEIEPKEDIAALIYTGGTTGRPKGVMLTHCNVLANALQCAYHGQHPLQAQSMFGKGATLIILPICHISGYVMLLTAVYEGSMLVMENTFDPKTICEAIQWYRVTKFPVVPTILVFLNNFKEITNYDFSSVTLVGCGAMALAPEVAHKFEELTGLKVFQGMGLTECCAAAISNPIWAPSLVQPGSVGTPILDTDAKIVDPVTEEELPIGGEGELWIRGPQLMKGYWRNPKTTEQALINGWMRTGDLARMDENGYVYLSGRLKDIIKYKGYKIFPDEIEAKMYEHEAVKECAVLGIPNDVSGEEIKAYIVLKDEYVGKISEKEIIDWSKNKLGPIKYPRKVEFKTSIPKTPAGKVFRRKLREEELKKQKTEIE